MTRPSGSPPPPGPDSPQRPAPGPSGTPPASPEPRTGTPQGLRAALAGLLRSAEGGASAEELADVLWVAELAGLTAEGGAPQEEEPDAPQDDAQEPPARPPAGQDASPPPPPGPAEETPGRDEEVPAAEPRVGLHPYAAAEGGPDGAGAGTAGHAVRVAQPPALDGALALARALRPLRQSVTAPGVPLLDEEATAQASGEAGRGRLVPVWRPAVRRRFSVDLVVDSGATMAVWHRLAAELCTVLERHGAFADVRCWALDTDAAVPRLMPFRRRQGRGEPDRAVRFPGPLEDSSGRRVLLVLTDAVGPAWYGADLPGFLADTAAQRPAAALQVLPRRLWHRTALRTVPVELRVPDPARPAPVVRTDAALPGRPAPGAVRWLPVMEVKGAWLAPWAELVAGRAPGWSPMLAAPVRGVPRPRRAVAPAPPADPAERVARFRSGASADAFRLACHLAAAPLSLPVMRLVQQATMPASEQTDLAELFVSGLIARRGPAGPEPDEVVYDFAPGVRDELLAELTRTESLRVLDDVLAKVSGKVAATFGGTLDFRALAARADVGAGGAGVPGDGRAEGGAAPGRVLPPASLPFAEVAVAVLSGAGGQHRAVARRLAAAVEGRGVPGPAVRRQGRPDSRPTPTAETGSGLPFPERLVPVPPLRVPPDLDQMIGRGYELDALKRQLQPATLRHTVVAVEGRLGMGARRLVQEYARQYGDRHAFVHWIDASRPDSLAAGLRSLGAALGRTPGTGEALDDIAETWRLLARHENWLLVLDDLGPEYDLGDADSFLPPQGLGSVLITTPRVYDGRRRADAVITLAPLTPAEVADHVRGVIGPELAARGEELSAAVLNRLVARLSTLPAELARVDVHAEYARESAVAARSGRPLYEWRVDGRVTGLAGYGGHHVVVAVSEGPVRLYRAAAGRVEATWLAEVERPVHAVATQTRPDGSVLLAVAHGSRVIWLDDPATSARLRPVGFVDFARGDARGPEGRPVTEGPGDAEPAPGDRPDLPGIAVLALVAREDGRGAVMTAGAEQPQQWDLGTGALLTTPPPIGAPGPVRALAVFEDQNARQRIVVVGGGTDRAWHLAPARMWYLATGAQCDEPRAGLLSGAIALATVRVPGRPDILAAVDGGPVVRFWDSATGGPAGLLDTRAAEPLVAVAVLSGRHGASRLATARADGLIQLWDIGAALDPPDPYASAAGAAAGPGRATPPAAEEAAAEADAQPPTPYAAEEAADVEPPAASAPPVPGPGIAFPELPPEFTQAESAATPDADEPVAPAGVPADQLFIAWLAHELGGEVGVTADVLTLLAPRSDGLIPELVASGVLERTAQDRFRLAERHRGSARPEVFDSLGESAGSLRGYLLRMLDTACPEATSATATWVPYTVLRAEMPSLLARMLDAEQRYASAEDAGPEVVLGIAARWAWYHLMRGAFASADRLAADAMAWGNSAAPMRFWINTTLADLRGQLLRVSLRASLAMGRGSQVSDIVERIPQTAYPQSRDVAEGQFALAEIALWSGRLERSDTLLQQAWQTLTRDGSFTADEAMAQRGRLLQAQHDLTTGRLRDAAKGLARAQQTVDALREQAATEAQAAADLAGGRTDAGESLEQDPAFGTARASRAALNVVFAELTLAVNDLTPPRPSEEPPAAPTTGEYLQSLADTVPDAYLHHFLTFCEQYALALVRDTAGPLWGRQGHTVRPRPAPPTAVAQTLDLVEPYRARQRTSRVLAYAGFLTVRGEAALAEGRSGPALGLLAQARSLIEDRYGPACPRLPRLRLLQAWGNHIGGMESLARRYVAEADVLLDALHGDAPHQDRVALLRAQAALMRDENRAVGLTQRAEQMAITLLDGVPGPPL